jgi:hypothetical protein
VEDLNTINFYNGLSVFYFYVINFSGMLVCSVGAFYYFIGHAMLAKDIKFYSAYESVSRLFMCFRGYVPSFLFILYISRFSSLGFVGIFAKLFVFQWHFSSPHSKILYLSFFYIFPFFFCFVGCLAICMFSHALSIAEAVGYSHRFLASLC